MSFVRFISCIGFIFRIFSLILQYVFALDGNTWFTDGGVNGVIGIGMRVYVGMLVEQACARGQLPP